jgi:predicted enzyme related to lactoylglutathione lyase
MIHGIHLLLYSTDAEADRAFFRNVLGWGFVDAGEGWLIFALPPTELGVHPANSYQAQVPANESLATATVYLMCDALGATVESLASKGVSCTSVQGAGWGLTTTFRLPSGAALGLYEPHHPLAIGDGTS